MLLISSWFVHFSTTCVSVVLYEMLGIFFKKEGVPESYLLHPIPLLSIDTDGGR
jgi:hypothetical protein